MNGHHWQLLTAQHCDPGGNVVAKIIMNHAAAGLFQSCGITQDLRRL
jgi:hypothetical protein